MIDKTQRLYESLDSFLTEYKEKNEGNKYRPVAVGRYGIRTRESIYSKELAKDYSKNKLIFKNTLTVGMGSTQIDIGVLSEDATYAVSPAYHTYRIHDINSDYLRYCLECRNQDMFVRYVKRGSRQGKSIDLKRWITYRIPVYPESVQAEIVKRLDSVKAILSLREQELNALDDLIKARFVEMFGDNQEVHKLSDIAAITGGLTKNSRRDKLELRKPYLRVANVFFASIDTTEILDIGLTKEEYEKTLLRNGDLLFVEGNGSPDQIGRMAIWNGEIEDCVHQNHLIKARFDLKRMNPVFAMYYFISERGRNQIKKRAVSTSGLYTLSVSKIADFEIPNPPMELQQQFAAFVAAIDKSKHHAPHLPNPSLKWYPLSKNEVPIMEEKIIAITNEMAEVLNIAQHKKLQEVLVKAFSTEEPERKPTNHEYLRLFLEAKSIEGCSPRTLQYYEVTVQHLFAAVNLPVRKMTTERMREYLSDYQQRRNCSKATIDNIRRNISSFFSWLEEEDHILKSPMRRIHKIKTKKTVKEVISDEDIEKLRDSCTSLRDLAMIDLLYSTGIRVGELVRLNIEDVNFESRECVVFGKGDKERRVYFDAKTKIHLKNYLESRRDTNRALFVSLLAPYNRLAISGVEIRLRKMGRMLNLKSIHPHKFRRTMATRAIDKGMPIEQVQKILGHSQIDTTMQYAIVNQNNVKMSHQKYIA